MARLDVFRHVGNPESIPSLMTILVPYSYIARSPLQLVLPSIQEYELSLIIVYSHFLGSPMARQLRANPRETASQERSRRTVDTILEWTTRVLIREEYGQASTNKLAAVANVSIGSLYRYFPSKEPMDDATPERLLGAAHSPHRREPTHTSGST